MSFIQTIAAVQASKAAPPPAKQTRACLSCGDDFRSDGKHNRICEGCNNRGGAPIGKRGKR